MYHRWTADEDDRLKSVYVTQPKSETMKIMGLDWSTIRRRAKRLGLKRPKHLVNEDKKKRGKRKDAWTDEDERTLREVYPRGTKKEILAVLKRPWKGIWSRAYKLGLRRDRDVVMREMVEAGSNAPPREDFWSEEERTLLKKVYPGKPKKELLSLFNRSWQSIRAKALSLGIKRDPDVIKADNVKGSSDAVYRKHGVRYSTLLPSMKEKSRKTNMEKLGVPYPTQSPEVRDKCRHTVKKKYGVDCVFKSDEVKRSIRRTNLERYGHPSAMQSTEIQAKAAATAKENNSFSLSNEEAYFYGILQSIDPSTECQVRHPTAQCTIDFYMPANNLWVQYDGDYWHGHTTQRKDTPRDAHIQTTMKRDERQNLLIPNLVRFLSSEIKGAADHDSMMSLVKSKLREKACMNTPCHQYTKKREHLESDLRTLPFDTTKLKAAAFDLSYEPYSRELGDFIKRYEWLGTIGNNPKWSFCARHRGHLAGVVLINEPNAYSNLLGSNGVQLEALIQRGATASWTPKNLGSRLVMFACRWMTRNTSKRVFIGYGDPKAHEIGTIYQSCNFEYLGNHFGAGRVYQNPSIHAGMPFTAQTLKRTSEFKKWCRANGIDMKPEWFRANGYKKMSAVPDSVKESWSEEIKRTLSESRSVPISKKHKYVLVMGSDKRDHRQLQDLKTYKAHPYPKRSMTDIGTSPVPALAVTSISKPKRTRGSRSRITKGKDEFILANYHSMTQDQIAAELGETKRWVQNRAKALIHAGTLKPKNPIGSTKSRITQEKIDFVREHRTSMSRKEIAEAMNETVRWVKRVLYKLDKDSPKSL